ncbi:MAG: alpha/beta hydrolase [Candidatus Heimdallarchaeota archaeon]|nr:alpha/beta hydrolase [Candidatus Heimdallarchaeota archaeon]MDH5646404.1 alpha/beta hydrolase [Candidatus Heimdallarchaeota archaeon]
MDKLTYKSIGNGSNLFCLIHPFPANNRIFDKVTSYLEADNWKIILPDLPGFGESLGDENKENWSMNELAEQINLIIDDLNFEKLVLGGVSMGGYVTMAYEKLYPNKANALILANTRDSKDSDGGQSRDVAIEMIQSGERNKWIKTFLIPKLFGLTTLTTKRKIMLDALELISNTPDYAFIQSLRGMKMREDSRDLLSKIEIPVLIITGEEDELTGPSIAQEMMHSYKKAQLEIIAEAGHYAPIENPAEFGTVIHKFLKTI